MKKILFSVLAGGLMLSLAYGTALAGEGNGLPPGQRFMLNVIAFDADNCPAGDFTGSNRHMIAVEADFNAGDLGATQAGTDKNAMVKQNTIKLAQDRGIVLLLTELPLFESCGKLYREGLVGCSEYGE